MWNELIDITDSILKCLVLLRCLRNTDVFKHIKIDLLLSDEFKALLLLSMKAEPQPHWLFYDGHAQHSALWKLLFFSVRGCRHGTSISKFLVINNTVFSFARPGANQWILLFFLFLPQDSNPSKNGCEVH